jgi:hypothetical protein
MRVLLWATHLQTDILSLACHLDRSPVVALMIVVPDPAAFLRSPFARARPLRALLLDRNDAATPARVRAFRADVAVADNHVPPRGSAPRLCYMWHGLGWKARSRIDLDIFYRQVRAMIGADPRTPTPNFTAQCYGPTDLEWRVRNWKLPRTACALIGMAFSDLLLRPPYAKEDFAADYKIDILRRKTVLLSITWHHGGIFAQSPGFGRMVRGLFGQAPFNARDAEFLRRIVETVDRRGANLLICLHDRHRYDPGFVAWIEKLAGQHDFVELRLKSEHPDNLPDLLTADVMLSNLSSFLAYFYVLGRPAVQILPVEPGARVERTVMLFSRFRLRRGISADDAWMIDPRDTGGPVVTNADQAMAALDGALEEPEHGAAAARDWLSRHVPVIDGAACLRFEQHLRRFCGEIPSLGLDKGSDPDSAAPVGAKEGLSC